MSSCNKCFARLVLYLTVISLLFVHSNADENLIRDICSKADDVNYCLNVFLSDPRCVTYSVHTLAMFAIQKAMLKAQDTIDYKISDLLKTTTDPVGKERLLTCQSDYTDAVVMFNKAFFSTDKNAYSNAKDWVIKGTNDVLDCQNVYQRKAPTAESPISAENNEIGVKLSAVILTVIANLLPQ